jgi:hypothetical protein
LANNKTNFRINLAAVGTGEGREAFAAAWRESLARASTAKEEAMAALWAQVFSGCATTEDVDAKRGLRPIIALRMYHGSVSESEARTLVEAFDKVRIAVHARRTDACKESLPYAHHARKA